MIKGSNAQTWDHLLQDVWSSDHRLYAAKHAQAGRTYGCPALRHKILHESLVRDLSPHLICVPAPWVSTGGGGVPDTCLKQLFKQMLFVGLSESFAACFEFQISHLVARVPLRARRTVRLTGQVSVNCEHLCSERLIPLFLRGLSPQRLAFCLCWRK